MPLSVSREHERQESSMVFCYPMLVRFHFMAFGQMSLQGGIYMQMCLINVQEIVQRPFQS